MEGKEFVLRAISPVVAVGCSETVKGIISDCKFQTFASFLRPLGLILDPIKINDNLGNPQQLDSATLRFVEYNELLPLELQTLEQNLISLVLPALCKYDQEVPKVDNSNIC